MDLRTGQAPWGRPTMLTRGVLGEDESCDVLVLGAGISGAMAAWHLAKAGLDVVIVDDGPIAAGSTAASTALIQYELDVPMVELVPDLGLADAQAVYRAMRHGLDDMRELVEGEAFDCDFTRRPSLYLAKEAGDVVHLRHEAIARAQIGIEAAWLDKEAVGERYGIRSHGAVRSAVAYELNPERLTIELLSAATQRLGARLYDRTRLSLDPWVGAVPTLRTSDGHSVQAGRIVYAIGYETPEQFPQLKPYARLKTTFALATRPVARDRLWAERALLWEYDTPYLYARTTPDDRLIVGGADEPAVDPAAREAMLPAKTRTLLERFEALTGLGGLEVDRSWAGTFAESPDGMPFIGAPDCGRHCYFSLGFGGNGILFAMIGAQIIRDAILGRSHAAARLFGFDRVTAPRPAVVLDLTCP